MTEADNFIDSMRRILSLTPEQAAQVRAAAGRGEHVAEASTSGDDRQSGPGRA